jgi:uncharacterized OB-fold protein
MHDVVSRPRAAMPYLRFDNAGTPYLLGARCGGCDAVALGERAVCNACGTRDRMAPMRLGTRGTLYNYTIVHRSFPGVKTPFVAAIVELEGGGAIKGTLVDVDPDPAALPFDMPVDLVFRETGQTSKDGEPFISHYFTPAGKAGR